MRRAYMVALAVGLALVPRALAAAPLAQEKLDLDGDGRVDVVSVTEDGKLAIASTRAPASEVPLGVEGWRLTRARLEQRVYARRVFLVRLLDVEGVESASLVELDARGILHRLWHGPVGKQGIDGEWAIQVALGDTMPLHFQTKDGVERCDGAPAQIARRGFDFASREWRPLGFAGPLPRPAGAVELRAQRGAPPAGIAAAQAPTVFHATAASSSEQDGGSAEDLTPPTELDDGKAETAWAEGRGSHGRGEFVTLRSRARPFKVVALRVVPGDAASPDAFARSNRLRRVHLVTDAGAAYVVGFEPEPAAPEPYWIVLPQPVAARCVSLVIDEVWPGRPGARAPRGKPADANRTAIAELAVFTDIDAGGPGALDTLAESVAAGDASEAQAAEDLLVERGAAAAAALVAAAGKPGRKPEERRRVRLALARLGQPAGAAEVVAGLVAASASPGARARTGRDAGAGAAAEHVRERDVAHLAEGLARMGAGAEAALAGLLADEKAPVAARAIAAELLGAMAGAGPRVALEAQLGRGGRALRRAVTSALGHRATDELPGALDAAVAAAAPGDHAARAHEADRWRVVALLAARPGAGRDRVAVAAAARLTAEPAPAYELRHRLVDALAAVSDEGAARPPLLAVLRSDPEPALRLAVVTGLTRAEHVRDAWSGQTLIEASSDADPGVRLAALAALGARSPDEATADPALVARLDGDRWPEVRAAAAAALATRCRRAPVADALLGALDREAADAVRRVALAGLVRCRDARIGARLLAILTDARQPTAWRQFAAVQIGALGDRALVPQVIDLFGRARRDAFGDDGAMWLATALARALAALADPRATRALVDAAADPAFWPVQAAAVDALAVTCPAGARRTVRAALRAESGQVVGAARRAVRACGWTR